MKENIFKLIFVIFVVAYILSNLLFDIPNNILNMYFLSLFAVFFIVLLFDKINNKLFYKYIPILIVLNTFIFVIPVTIAYGLGIFVGFKDFDFNDFNNIQLNNIEYKIQYRKRGINTAEFYNENNKYLTFCDTYTFNGYDVNLCSFLKNNNIKIKKLNALETKINLFKMKNYNKHNSIYVDKIYFDNNGKTDVISFDYQKRIKHTKLGFWYLRFLILFSYILLGYVYIKFKYFDKT